MSSAVISLCTKLLSLNAAFQPSAQGSEASQSVPSKSKMIESYRYMISRLTPAMRGRQSTQRLTFLVRVALVSIDEMDSSHVFIGIAMCHHSVAKLECTDEEEPMCASKIISIDLAKDVFELCIATARGRVLDRKRLNRKQFARFIATTEPAIVVMETCGSAHFWGRCAESAGHQVRLLPAHYVKAYRRRNKTDRADVDALLAAFLHGDLQPVPVRCV